MNFKKISWGSVITGLLLGNVTGWLLNTTLPEFYLSNLIYFGIPIIFFTSLAFKKPISTEYLSYGLCALIVFNFVWDYAVGDRNYERWYLFISAIIAILINAFTGKVRISGAKKTFKRSIGLN